MEGTVTNKHLLHGNYWSTSREDNYTGSCCSYCHNLLLLGMVLKKEREPEEERDRDNKISPKKKSYEKRHLGKSRQYFVNRPVVV